MAEALIPITGTACGTLMIVAVVWLVTSSRLKSAQIHADTVGKVVDKIGTSQEARAYIESEPGKKLLDSFTTKPGNPYSRILGAATIGVVLSALGAGLLVFGSTDVGDPEAIGGGIVVLSLGIGFLLAAGVSYKLSKSWGLVNGNGGSSTDSQPPGADLS